MRTEIIEILKLVASFMTPLIILIFGIIINRRLEKNKVSLAKEKDWQSWWAGKLLDVAHEYNTAVSELVTDCFRLVQINDQKLPGWEVDDRAITDKIKDTMYRIQYLDWEIQNYIQFIQNNRDIVMKTQKILFELLKHLLSEKQGNLEEIRKAQFEFNEAVRLAHAELLLIVPNRSLQRMIDK